MVAASLQQELNLKPSRLNHKKSEINKIIKNGRINLESAWGIWRSSSIKNCNDNKLISKENNNNNNFNNDDCKYEDLLELEKNQNERQVKKYCYYVNGMANIDKDKTVKPALENRGKSSTPYYSIKYTNSEIIEKGIGKLQVLDFFQECKLEAGAHLSETIKSLDKRKIEAEGLETTAKKLSGNIRWLECKKSMHH